MTVDEIITGIEELAVQAATADDLRNQLNAERSRAAAAESSLAQAQARIRELEGQAPPPTPPTPPPSNLNVVDVPPGPLPPLQQRTEYRLRTGATYTAGTISITGDDIALVCPSGQAIVNCTANTFAQIAGRNITIRGLDVRGMGTRASVFNANNDANDNVTIERCRAICTGDTTGEASFVFAQGRNITVKECSFATQGKGWIVRSYAKAGLRVLNNVVLSQNPEKAMIRVLGAIDGGLVMGNRLLGLAEVQGWGAAWADYTTFLANAERLGRPTDWKHALTISGEGQGTARNVVVRGNTLVGGGIRFEFASAGVELDGNSIATLGFCIAIDGKSEGLKVTGNVMRHLRAQPDFKGIFVNVGKGAIPPVQSVNNTLAGAHAAAEAGPGVAKL